MEGIVPVPFCRPVLKSNDDVVPVQVVSHLGGGKAAGVKPRERSVFLKKNISPEPKISP